MKCNQCGKQMKQGYIQSSKPILWGEKQHKLLFEREKTGEIRVSKNGLIGSFAQSYYCDKCELVITPVTQSNGG